MAKRILCAFAFGVDVDAVAGWLGTYGVEDSPDDISRGLFAGEIGMHGYSHENPIAMTREQETAVLDKSLEVLTKFAGRAPSEAADAGVNGVSGRVAAVEYQGTWLKISIEDACGEEFVANVPDGEFFADPLTIGDPVLARWDADKVHFLDSGAKASAGSAQAGHSEMASLERR